MQTLPQTAAFIGLAFSPDGKTLYASGGNDDAIYVYRWNGRQATADGKIVARDDEARSEEERRTQYPAGIAISHDGRFLYVAENLGDTLAVVDLASGKRRPASADRSLSVRASSADARGDVYVSAWGERRRRSSSRERRRNSSPRGAHRRRPPSVGAAAQPRRHAALRRVGRAPTRSRSSTRRRRKVVQHTDDAAAGRSARGEHAERAGAVARRQRLFVAEADNNAVAVFDVATRQARSAACRSEWYPTALARRRRRPARRQRQRRAARAPNPKRPQPADEACRATRRLHARADRGHRSASMSCRVGESRARSRRASRTRTAGTQRAAAPRYPPFKHVIYIIKENRTYDQVLGDMPEGDGDPSLRLLPARRLAESSRAGRALRALRPLLRQCRGERAGAQLVDGGVHHRLPREDHAVAYASAAGLRLRGDESRRALVDDDDDVDDAGRPDTCGTCAARKGISLRNYGEFVRERGEDRRRTACKTALRRAMPPRRLSGVRHRHHRSDARRRLAATSSSSTCDGGRCRRCRSCGCRTITPRAARGGRAHAARVHGGQRPRPRPHRRARSRTRRSGATRSSSCSRMTRRTAPTTSTRTARCCW